MIKKFDLKHLLAPVADIVRKLKDRRSELLAEVKLVEEQIDRLERGMATNRRTPAAAGAKRTGRRKRRSRANLEGKAIEVVKFVSSRGKEGATGREIKEQFGDLLPSVNAWLKNYSADKVRTTGARSSMRYHV